MSNKRPLKAYVRFDGSGRAVSSSLIWRKNKPKVGKWQEVQGYECCNGDECPPPPLFTPIEIRAGLGDGPCSEPYITANWFIYQTSLFGIPIVKIVTDTNLPSPTPADAGEYFVPSISKVINVATEGLITNVTDCG